MPHYGSGWQRFGLWSRFCFKIYCDYIKQLMSGFKSSTDKYFIWAWKVSLLAPLSFSVVPSDWRNLRPCLAAQPQTHPEHGIRDKSPQERCGAVRDSAPRGTFCIFPIHRISLWLSSQRILPHHFRQWFSHGRFSDGQGSFTQTLSSHNLVLAMASFSTKT